MGSMTAWTTQQNPVSQQSKQKGIKIYAFIDVKTYYSFNLRHLSWNLATNDKPNGAVNRFVPIYQINLNGTFDNWFTSF